MLHRHHPKLATLLREGRPEDRAAKVYKLLWEPFNTALDDGRIKRTPCRIKGAGEHRAPERMTATVPQVYVLAELMPDRTNGYGGPSDDPVGLPFYQLDGAERATGIEPAWPAWKAGALPLSYARMPRRSGGGPSVPASVVVGHERWSRRHSGGRVRCAGVPVSAPGCGAAW